MQRAIGRGGVSLASLCAAGTLVLAIPAIGWAQPAVSAVVPAAVTPGKTVELTLQGTKLDDPLTLWASFPGKLELVPPKEPKPGQTTRTVKVTLEANVPVGIGGLILATPDGATDPILVMVDDLPSVADDGKNQAPAQAQLLALPVAVDGVSDGSRFDYYKFAGQAGQRVAVEVFAARLGQDFDPVIRLLDASGKELAVADDDAAAGADCRLGLTLPAAGEFMIEVRDNQFRGGGRYRLRVGDFPLAATAFPLGVQAGTTAKVGAAGIAVEGVAAQDVAVPADRAGEQLSVGVKYTGGAASAIATIVASRGPEAVEAEPNNEIAQANKVEAPGAVSGRYDTAKDRDCFQFEAKAGQRFAFRAYSRSLGSPAIVKMYLQKADGAAVAESAVSDADEETLVVAIPADGSYRLVTQDLLKRGGPDFTYRIAIESPAPFSLALKPDKATKARYALAPNGAMAIDVPVARSGYDGPITLSVEGPGGVYQVFNHVIPEKQAATRMIVLPPAGLAPGQVAVVRVRGTATVNGQPFTAVTSTIDLARLNRPALTQPPSWIDGLIPTAVSTPLTPFFTAALDKQSVDLVTTNPQAEFNVLLERKVDAYKDPLAVTFPNAPPGLTFEVKRNGNGPKETYQVIVKAAAGTPPGTHLVKVLSYGELAGKGMAVISGDLPINVLQPVTVSLSPAGAVVFGNKQKVRIAVARASVGGVVDKQPVVVKWKKLPAGVTAPPEVTIPADQDSAVVELVAAADAAAGSFADLAATAATKFQGKDLTVESAALSGEIVK